MKNNNALKTSRLLGDQIRNEEAINSTRNRIYSLKAFHFLLYRRSSILSFLQEIYFSYRIEIERRVYNYAKIQGPRFERNYIIVRDQKREKGRRVISIITENKPHAHHKTYQQTMKVFNTRSVSITIEVLLTKILFFPSTEVFTCL